MSTLRSGAAFARRQCFSVILFCAAAWGLGAAALAADVRDFGAKGDGVADDTAAVEKAVAAGGEVRFAKGTYRLSRTVEVDLAKFGPISIVGESATIEMHGAGPALLFKGTVAKTASPNDFPPGFWAKERMPLVRGLAIMGRHPEAVGIRAVRTMELTIVECHLQQLLYGVHITERNRNIVIANTHIYNCNGIGVYIDHCDVHQINIGNCHISYNKAGGIVGRGGAIRNLQIGACDIEANVDAKVPPTANVQLDSTDGSIGEVEITGCTLQHYPGIKGFANLRFIGHSIPVSFTPEKRHGNLIVTGNLMNDADINIHLDGVRGAVISGNSIQLANSHDLLVENSSHVVFSNTVMDRHPRYNPDRANAPPVIQGIEFRNSDHCTITGLRINGGKAPAAIAVHGGAGHLISQCAISDVQGVGLLLEGVEHSLVQGNLFLAPKSGAKALRVTKGSANSIQGNVLEGDAEVDPGSGTFQK
jgi:hypothetical protein